jgi:hypothetical protein
MHCGMNLLNPRTSIVLFASLSLAGCAVAGERAGSLESGECPSGETCSDLTPKGLFFVGAPASDSILGAGFNRTAIGGTQTVTALTAQGANAPPFENAFTATSASPDVISVDAVTPPKVVVRGVAEGTSLLRLIEPGTTKLLDRVEVEVAKVAKVTLLPRGLVVVKEEAAPWALLAGSTASLVVRLTAEDEKRLVDETTELTPASGAATRQAWDLFEVTAPTSGEASFQIKAGGESFTATAPVVSAIEEIAQAPTPSTPDAPAQVTLDATSTLCFLARSGGAAVDGATWTFVPSESVTLSEMKPELLSLPSCVSLRGMAAGPATLTVTASGITKVFDLMVTKQKTTSLKLAPLSSRLDLSRSAVTPSAGERAMRTFTW